MNNEEKLKVKLMGQPERVALIDRILALECYQDAYHRLHADRPNCSLEIKNKAMGALVEFENFVIELESEHILLMNEKAQQQQNKDSLKTKIRDKNLNTKDRLDAVIEYLGLDL